MLNIAWSPLEGSLKTPLEDLSQKDWKLYTNLNQMDGGMKIIISWAPVRAKNETLYGLKPWICLNLMCYKMYPILPLR